MNKQEKSILVTGGSGYLGSVLVPLLLQEGYKVCVLDAVSPIFEGSHGLKKIDNFSFVQGDIRSVEALNQVLPGSYAVIHLASIVGDPACAHDPHLAIQVNRNASIQLFNMAKANNIQRFIFASSCSNYGKLSDGQEYATEETLLEPTSIYAKTKIEVEKELLSSDPNKNPAATILRFATLYGLSPRMRFDLTVNQFTKAVECGEKLTIYAAKTSRPYVHVMDVSRAIVLTLRANRNQISGQVFNVGDTQENYQKGQLVELIVRLVGRPAEIEYKEVNEQEMRNYRVSFEKIKNKIGFSPTCNVRDGVGEIIQAIRDRKFSVAHK